MLRLFHLFLAILVFSTLPARANETVVAGLSQNQVAITATFVGSEILVFGAVKRDGPAPTDTPLNVVVVIEGPSSALIVRRKTHAYGIWMNTAEAQIQAAPSFYAVATSGSFSDAVDQAEDARLHISIPQSIHLAADSEAIFAEAIIRIRQDKGLYKLEEGAVDLREETLFSTSISLPSNLTEGEYHARIYLTRDGKVVSDHVARIDVRKVGMERWIYNLAHEKPLIYGLLSLFIAIAAGWGASTAFRVFMRS